MPNPFEPIPPERLAAIYHWPPAALRFLAGEGDCLHVIGAAGMGKTTLLRQVDLRLAGEGRHVAYTYIPLGGMDSREVAMGDVALVDEADRLSPSALGEVLLEVGKRGVRLALGTHHNLTRRVRACNLTCLPVALRPLRDAGSLAACFTGRVRLAGLNCRLSPGASRALLRHSRGNIERALQIGYELFEDLTTPGEITAEQVVAAARSLDRAMVPTRPPAASR